MKTTLLLLILFLFFPVFGHAQLKVTTTEGTYYGDAEMILNLIGENF